MPLINVHNVTKVFPPNTKALDDISFNIESGEMVALVGPSGSGKSTLIRAIAGLEKIDKKNDGVISLFGEPIQQNGKILNKIKSIRRKMGIIFQSFNLIGRLSVEKNVLTGLLGVLPRWRGTIGWFFKNERIMALNALNRVGILAQSRQRASTLSGGQQQRAAIARTLVQESEIIFADEPVASLDPAAADRVMQTLSQINSEDKATIIVSLHQIEYALKYCKRIVALKDGKLLFDGMATETSPEFFADLYGRKIDHDDN